MTDIDVTVIGGGAAGLMAAVSAARCGARTRVIEHMDRIGKKILSTGNGKCNYTNAVQGLSCYRGENLLNARNLGIPVKYIGVGETIEDLQKFDSNQFVNALFEVGEEKSGC